MNAINTTHKNNSKLNICSTLKAFLLLSLIAPTIQANDTAYHAKETVNQAKKTIIAAERDIARTGCIFETTFSALALKPLASNIHYTAVTADNGTIYDVNPTYQFGFDLGFVAHICSLDSKISLNWERVHTWESIHTSNKSPLNLFLQDHFSTMNFDFDEVNLNYGQHMVYDNYLQGNLYYGLSFAHIKQFRNSTYNNDNNDVLDTSIATPSISSFNGAGIQVGFDFSYDITRHFQLAGEGALSLLAGKSNYYIAPLLSEVSDEVVDAHAMRVILNKTQLVPALQQKIGLAYVLPYAQRCHFKLEAGYQAQVYLNALQSTLPAATSDFALIGPYVTMSLGF